MHARYLPPARMPRWCELPSPTHNLYLDLYTRPFLHLNACRSGQYLVSNCPRNTVSRHDTQIRSRVRPCFEDVEGETGVEHTRSGEHDHGTCEGETCMEMSMKVVQSGGHHIGMTRPSTYLAS